MNYAARCMSWWTYNLHAWKQTYFSQSLLAFHLPLTLTVVRSPPTCHKWDVTTFCWSVFMHGWRSFASNLSLQRAFCTWLASMYLDHLLSVVLCTNHSTKCRCWRYSAVKEATEIAAAKASAGRKAAYIAMLPLWFWSIFTACQGRKCGKGKTHMLDPLLDDIEE